MVSHVIRCDNTKCRVHNVYFTLYRDIIMNMAHGVDCDYFDGQQCCMNKKINGFPHPTCDYIADRHLFPDKIHETTEVVPLLDTDLSEIPLEFSSDDKENLSESYRVIGDNRPEVA